MGVPVDESQTGVFGSAVPQASLSPHLHVSSLHCEDVTESHITAGLSASTSALHSHAVLSVLHVGLSVLQPDWGDSSPLAVLEHTEHDPSTWQFRSAEHVPCAVPSPVFPSTLHETQLPRVASRMIMHKTLCEHQIKASWG